LERALESTGRISCAARSRRCTTETFGDRNCTALLSCSTAIGKQWTPTLFCPAHVGYKL
jgi:hypothetical protein